MKIRTQTGSIYEIDERNKRAKRLSGHGQPTPRVGEDGQWKNFEGVSPAEVGKPILFIWGINGDSETYTNSLALCIGQATETSPVVEILSDL